MKRKFLIVYLKALIFARTGWIGKILPDYDGHVHDYGYRFSCKTPLLLVILNKVISKVNRTKIHHQYINIRCLFHFI